MSIPRVFSSAVVPFVFIIKTIVGTEPSVSDTSLYVLPKDTVTAVRREGETVSIAREQQHIGLTDDVAKVLFMKPGIGRIPEAGSSLLVNGQGPYDNQFVVCGVPMFSTSHFSNARFADVSGLTIETLKDVTLVTRKAAGRYWDAPGAVVQFEPGIYRPSNPRWRKRPELTLNAGTLNHDVSVSVPFRADDFYQVTINHFRDYTGQWFPQSNIGNQYPAMRDYTMPRTFVDIMLTGSTKVGDATMKQFGWLALDGYDASTEELSADGKMSVVPWGMAAVNVDGAGRLGDWKVRVGGSRQHYYDGKRLGSVYPRKHVLRDNVNGTASLTQVTIGPFLVDGTVQSQFIDWDGCLERQENVWDSLFVEDTILAGQYVRQKTEQFSEARKEVEISTHGGIQHWPGSFGYGINLLAGALLPYKTVFIDPGIWCSYVRNNMHVDAGVGVQTSHPDIRGLPSKEYRGRLIKTYSASTGMTLDMCRWSTLTAEAYVKYGNHCPHLSNTTGDLRWDPAAATPIFARGTNIELHVAPFKVLELMLQQSFSSSQRLINDTREVYEWDIPWSTKLVVALQNRSKTIGVFLSGICCAGLPYRDVLWNGETAVYADSIMRMPYYRRVDLKIQFKQPIPESRYVTRFDLYLDIPNIAHFIESQTWDNNFQNTREYYWDADFNKRPITLLPYSFSAGLRLGFRL